MRKLRCVGVENFPKKVNKAASFHTWPREAKCLKRTC